MKIRTLPVYSKVAGETPKEVVDNLPAKVSMTLLTAYTIDTSRLSRAHSVINDTAGLFM